jgi:hypothetical protein
MVFPNELAAASSGYVAATSLVRVFIFSRFWNVTSFFLAFDLSSTKT